MKIGDILKGFLGVPLVLVGFTLLMIGVVGSLSSSILSSIFQGLTYTTNVFLVFAVLGLITWIAGIYLYFRYANALANLFFGLAGICIVLFSSILTILGLLSIPGAIATAGLSLLVSSAIIFFGLIGVALGLSFVQFGLGIVIYKPLNYVTKLFIGFTRVRV